MPPTSRRSYKVTKSDNALSPYLAPRLTYPQGSYIGAAPQNYITPYTMSTGTQASGLAGQYGASSAMYPPADPRAQYSGRSTNYNASQYGPTLPPMRSGTAPQSPLLSPTGYGVPAQIQAGFSQPHAGQSPGQAMQGTFAWRERFLAKNLGTAPAGTSALNAPPPAAAVVPQSDFMKTNFMQYNTANNISFENQLRWDPSSKKYVKIGDLLRQGKLDLQGNTYGGYGGRGGNSRPYRPAATSNISQNFVTFRA
jgi:hypothetical protein